MDKQKKLGGDIDFPHTFIRQVCMYLWYKEMRKRRRRRVELFGVAEDAVGYGGEERGGGGDQEGEGDSVWEGAEMAMLLLRCLEKMSAICRELLTLYSLGYSESRIGEVMNINSRESVKNRKYKCKSKLRTLIINDPLFDEIYR